MYTKKQLRKIVKEEAKTAKEYKRHGFPSLAKAEARHAAFFRMLLKKR